MNSHKSLSRLSTLALRTSLSAALVASLAACDPGAADPVERAAQAAAQAGPATVAAGQSPEHQLPDALELATDSLEIDSEADLRLAAERVRDARPRLFDAVMSMQPRSTRNDLLRFIDAEQHDPDAAAVFALRMLEDADAPKLERLALADAIARTMGDFGAYIVVLIASEPDPEVRATLIHQMRRASPASAARALQLGLHDSEPMVREAAYRTLASHPTLPSARLGDMLRDGLRDNDAQVRSQAAFAARVLANEESLDELISLAQRDQGDARIQALRAIKKIDADALATLDMTALAEDEDPRVARFVAEQAN